MRIIPGIENYQRLSSPEDILSKVLPNILDRYSQYTYHFRLFMLSEDAIRKKEFRRGDKNNRIILAESASTSIAIEDVTIISVGGMSKDYGIGLSQKFEIVIKQPFGATFLDTIAIAADALEIKQFQGIPYFLELTFRARDPETQEPIRDDNLSDLAWIWPVIFQKSDIDITSDGSTYTITGTLFGDQGYNNQGGDLRKPITVTGITVGDIIKNVESELNKREEEDKYDQASISNQYEFIVDDDIAKLKIIPDNFSEVSQRHATLDTENETTQISFLPRTSIQSVIDMLLASTRYFQEQVANSPDPDAGPSDRIKMIKFLYRVVADTELLDFDPRLNDYAKKYTYLITKYETATLISSPDEKKLNDDEERAFIYYNRGRLRKYYNYIYTGLNDQVLNFDVKFNFAFFSMLPEAGGRTSNPNIIDSGRGLYDNEGRLAIDNNNYRENRATSFANTSPARSEEASPIEGLLDAPSNRSQTNIQLDQRQVTPRKLARELLKDNDDEIIAEKIFERSQKAINNGVKVVPRFKIDKAPTDRDYSQEDQSTPGRTLLSALFEQLTSPLSNSLVSIEMEIKGDPYWLEPDPTFPIRDEQGFLGRRNKSPGSFIQRELERRSGEGIDREVNEQSSAQSNNSVTGQTFFLFRSFTPEPFDPDSGLQAPKNNSNTVINGVYFVEQVINRFSQGKFTQTLKARRDPSLNVNGLRFDPDGNLIVTNRKARPVQQATTESTEAAIRSRTSEEAADVVLNSAPIPLVFTLEQQALAASNQNPPEPGWEFLDDDFKIRTLKSLDFDPVYNPIGRKKETSDEPTSRQRFFAAAAQVLRVRPNRRN